VRMRDRWLAPLRHTLGDEAAAVTMAEGRTLRVEQAVALARVDLSLPTRAARQDRAGASARLTSRERQVAVLLTRGLSNRQIAEELVITERTAAAHIEHLLRKLGFASRHQVGVWAAENGLVN
jgi:DNA-binding NarL/FixJ family response regulator